MRTLFVGDVHACADELEALLELTQPTRIILLGDLFTKGPHPKRLWKLIKKHRMETVLGNHDQYTLLVKKKSLPQEAYEWLACAPLFIRGKGFCAVHAGLNPEGPTLFEEAIYMRRWPMSQKKAPFWWKDYRGDILVLYGHDAIRSLQDHRPYTLGLDSGCVYGGSLTGYVLEEDRLYQVKAKKAYRPV